MLTTILNPSRKDHEWDEHLLIFRSLQAIYAPGVLSDAEIEDIVVAVRDTYAEIADKAAYMMKNR